MSVGPSTLERAATDALRPAPGTLVVDARALHASGIGRYLRELLTVWIDEPPFEALTLLGEVSALRRWMPRPTGALPVTLVEHAGAFYGAQAQRSWLRVRAHPAVREARASFFPHWDAPLLRMPPRAVVTVHDLIPFRVPGAFPAHKRAVGRPALMRVLRTAERVVCVSHASAEDVRSWAPAFADKVVAIPNGVPLAFSGAAEAALPVGVRLPYLLCVGNQKPHKNLAAAVGVLARLRAAGHHDLRLVVVGQRFSADADVLRAAEAQGVGDAVTALGEVPDTALHALYASCAVFLFPSRYEGFGLPVLEAMLAGAPVVASSTPAVAEVAGDAADLYAPDDVEGMAAACHRLLVDAAFRRARATNGRARSLGFRWVDAARRTGRLLQAVGAGGRA